MASFAGARQAVCKRSGVWWQGGQADYQRSWLVLLCHQTTEGGPGRAGTQHPRLPSEGALWTRDLDPGGKAPIKSRWKFKYNRENDGSRWNCFQEAIEVLVILLQYPCIVACLAAIVVGTNCDSRGFLDGFKNESWIYSYWYAALYYRTFSMWPKGV